MAYTFTGRQTGTIRFEPDDGTMTRERQRFSSQVTSNPIESGSDIHDHVINEPERLTVNGVIIGGDEKKAALLRARDKRDIMTYTGRLRASNLVFTSLDFTAEAGNKDGFAFTAQLQRVYITEAQTVEIGAVPLMTRQDARAAAPAVAQQTSRETNAGTQTILTQTISNSAYAAFVNSYIGGSSAGPTTRGVPAFNGVSGIMAG